MLDKFFRPPHHEARIEENGLVQKMPAYVSESKKKKLKHRQAFA